MLARFAAVALTAALAMPAMAADQVEKGPANRRLQEGERAREAA